MPWRFAVSLAAAASLVASALGQTAGPAKSDAYTSGLDFRALDTSVRPQDDLYRFVNGGWLDTTEIPPDRVTWGTFVELVERSQADVHAIIEESARKPNRRKGSAAQQVGDLYTSMADEARLEELGFSPIKPQLQRIDAVTDVQGIAAEAGHLSAESGGGPFHGSVTVDAFNSGARIVQVGQGGTLLPDRDYYLKQDRASVEIRGKYEHYLTTVFRLIGRPAAADEARAVLAFETELARGQSTAVESRRPLTVANRFSLSQMRAEMPGFDWRAWAKPQGLEQARNLLLTQPSFFKRFAEIVAATPIDTLKAWLRSRYITWASIYLDKAFNEARFEFFGRVLTGQEAPIVRWKRAVSLVNGSLGDSVGQLYVDKHFPQSAKVRVEALVARMLKAFRQAIEESDWLRPTTKRQALEKLAVLSTKVGYPDSWRDYSSLTVRHDDLFGNVHRIQRFQNAYRMNRLAQLTDPGQWLMTPQTVNAYYAPATNEIVLPAGILQPPLFNAEADDAENYGAIGAIFGHEIGHGFDQRGRTSNGRGEVRDWWSPEDGTLFRQRSDLLVQQFNAYSPIPGMHVNGELTRGENIGDLGGLAIAYRAYKDSLSGRPSPLISGFSGEQRFFMSWARAWRSKERDEYMRQWLTTNPYAPARYRANGPVSNMPEFYEAFGVKPGDRLYRAAADRVKIW
jgi:putative endopeptidase